MSSRRADLDCLFVHVPKFSSEYLPLGEFINITYMPMGLLALAELLQRRGLRSEIVHLGVEWLNDPGYKIAEELESRHVRMVAFPLYWHYQAYDTIEVARAVKAASPDTFVVFGGLTASYFADEILRDFGFVDAVLQGHAEGSLPVLAGELATDAPDLARVPYLHYRVGESLHTSPKTFHASQESLDELVFADFSLLRHAEVYIANFGFPLALSKEYRPEEHREHGTMGRTFFPLCVGRGCPTSCTYCAGNRDNLRFCNGRNTILWRDPERVIEDIRRAKDAGYRTMSLCFDPSPRRPDYYLDLFARIRKAKLGVDFYFENWGLPTPEFLQSFAETFEAPHSYMAYSPDTGSDAVRKLNKGFYYTTEELRESIRQAEGRGVQLDVFFSIALPGENAVEALKTRDLITEIREGYGNIRRLMTWSVQLEPGSPQYEHPERFGMMTDRHGFMDFYRAHGGPRADTYSSLGFKISDYFGDERDKGGILEFEAAMQHFKCMEFCFLSPDPRQRVSPEEGRRHCLERREKIAARRGADGPQRVICDEHRYGDAAQAMRPGPQSEKRPEWT